MILLILIIFLIKVYVNFNGIKKQLAINIISITLKTLKIAFLTHL